MAKKNNPGNPINLGYIENKFICIDKKFNSLETRVNNLEKNMIRIEERIKIMGWGLGVAISILSPLITALIIKFVLGL